jgi:DNA-binding protein HU-beta
MNRKELLQSVASKTDMSMSKSEQALAAILETITKALSKGDDVVLVGFGTFKVAKRAARNGRNPQTGKVIKIAARKVARFSAGKQLKLAVNKGK